LGRSILITSHKTLIKNIKKMCQVSFGMLELSSIGPIIAEIYFLVSISGSSEVGVLVQGTLMLKSVRILGVCV